MTSDNKTTKKNTANSAKSAAKGGKTVAKKPAAKKRTKSAAGQAADVAAQFKSLGVGLMLLGLLLGLWFLWLAAGVLLGKPTAGQAVLGLLAGAANVALAGTFVYLGYALYSERRGRFDSWQVTGWCCFLLAFCGLLHSGQFADGLAGAYRAAMSGLGGGVCGLVANLPVFWLPVAARYIILGAFFLLGIMLGSNMRVFGWLAALPALFVGIKNSLPRFDAEDDDDRADEPEEQPKRPVKRPKQTQGEVLLPPVVTEYSGRRFEETPKSDYDKVTVEDMMAHRPGTEAVLPGVPTPEPTPEILSSLIEQKLQAEKLEEIAAAELAEQERIRAQRAAAVAWATKHHTVELEDDADALPDKPVKVIDTAEKYVEPPHMEPPIEKTTEKTTEKPAEKAEKAPEIKPENRAEDKPLHTELHRVVNYHLPPVSLMKGGSKGAGSGINDKITNDSRALENVLASFGVKTRVVEVICGPSIIRYELQPAPGVKISRIVNLADDIALALAARGLRIEAPVPGKSVVGIEVARDETSPVYFKDVLASDTFQKSKSKISIAFGVDINGNAIVGNLADMPHLLIAGATGSGKSVCMNTLICSILYKAKPDEVKFIMVDPKKVEMTGYVGLPHLGRPVVTDAKKAAQVLKEVVNEMERRYLVFVSAGVKNFATYNELPDVQPLPQIVVLIDELADLMMVASKDVEDSICRLAQMARAAGIHLVIATQRPSVDVITGLIKANIPSRIAFAVSSQIDSRTILDSGGAEKLLGKGDMLYFPIGRQKPLRVQGAFLTEDEIHDLVEYCKQQAEPEYLELPKPEEQPDEQAEEEKNAQDELFIDACQQVISSGQASASSLQRRFRIGYNRAARLIDTMQELGIVSAPDGNKRTVLMNMPTFVQLYVNPPAEQAAADKQENGENGENHANLDIDGNVYNGNNNGED